MSLLQHALRAGSSGVAAPASARRAGLGLLVAGGAGPLGSAVLERALAIGPWRPVTALVTQPIEVALEGLRVAASPDDWSMAPEASVHAECALIVFDRDASAHGREAAFLRPRPAELPALARWLQRAGVRRLLLVLPHAPALLPAALKAGLASLDEQAVAALGFEQFTIVRPARAGTAAAGAAVGEGRLQRLGRALLSQLHWMVPQREQPLRAAKIAEFVVELARGLPGAPHGTRVVPPELLWDWAQPGGGDRVLQAWLQAPQTADA
ncbi:MAG TPA: hypothetical protein VD932_06215 [Aquabacterium sp.]|nr:hypothetical protein [Aquabacterium sp.]